MSGNDIDDHRSRRLPRAELQPRWRNLRIVPAPHSCDPARSDIFQKALRGQSIRGVEIQPPLSDDAKPAVAVGQRRTGHIDGGKHVLITLNDITDRKRAEKS